MNYNSYQSQTIRGYKRKLFFVDYLGGECKVCGYKKNLASFNFHHRNPDQKTFPLDIRNMSNRSFETLKNEVEKCDLLCANCHGELHFPNLEMEIITEFIKEYGENRKLDTKRQQNHCVDCNCEILYTSTRCKVCKDKKSRKVSNRPSKDELLKKLENKSQQKVADEYGVSRTTIKRWLNK